MALSYYAEELKKTASTIAQPGKGILAVDESTKTVGKRLASIDVENTEENRKAYRGMLFTTEGLGQYISGAILLATHSSRGFIAPSSIADMNNDKRLDIINQTINEPDKPHLEAIKQELIWLKLELPTKHVH